MDGWCMSPWAAAALEHIQHVAKTPQMLQVAARFVIHGVEHRKPQQAEMMALATKLGEHAAMFAKWLSGRDLDAEREGMLEIDARAAEYLAALGEPGKAEAAQLASEARTRWEKAGAGSAPGFLWSAWDRDREAGVSPFVARLARLLWTGWAEPGLADESEPEAAIPSPAPGSAGADAAGENEEAPATPAPSVSLPVLDALCEEFLGKMPFHGSERKEGLGVIGHRLFRWLVMVAAEGNRTLVMPGGLKAVAGHLLMKAAKAATEIGAALDRIASTPVDLPHGSPAPLLQWSHRRGMPGRPAEVRITIGDALLPNYVVALPKVTHSQRQARILVPIPGSWLPRIGNQRTWAAQALLELLVLREMRLKAEEYLVTGWVRITGKRWKELAIEAGLEPAMLGNVLTSWLLSGEDQFLVLDPEDEDRYGLSDRYKTEREAILKAGKKVAGGKIRRKKAKK